MADFCSKCGNHMAGRATCPTCGTTVAKGAEELLAKFAALGRLRMAGFTIGGGGLALVLSAFLPWVTALGVIDARPPGPGIVVILALGGTLMFLAARVLQDKATTVIRILLRLLAGLDTLVVIGFFAVVKAASRGVGGFLQATGIVRPAIGFYLALIGLGSSIAGTILMQIAKQQTSAKLPATTGTWGQPATQSQNPAATWPAPHRLSPDGRYWWDGTVWKPTSEPVPTNHPDTTDTAAIRRLTV